jgi:hypothetical protein
MLTRVAHTKCAAADFEIRIFLIVTSHRGFLCLFRGKRNSAAVFGYIFMSHIEKERLIQVSHTSDPINLLADAEWDHLKMCPRCLDLYVEIVRESEAKTKKASDHPAA